MDYLTGGAIGLLFIGGGVVFMNMSLDAKFPKIEILCIKAGTVQTRKFRLMGSCIMIDNAIQLLMNQYQYVGDITALDYLTKPNGSKLYVANVRHDFLIGMDLEELRNIPGSNPRVNIRTEKDSPHKGEIKSIKMHDAVLAKVTIDMSPANLKEKDIYAGKYVAARLFETIKSSKAFVDAGNPFMAVVIASIPLLVMGGLFCLMIYFAYMGLTDGISNLEEQTRLLIGAANAVAQ